MSGERLIYWDSCCFIHLFQKTPDYFAALDEIRSRAKDGHCKIITSAVALVEVCKIPGTGQLPIQQTNQILKFFENDYVEVWQADRFVCEEAHHIIRQHDLFPMDAIHLATALLAKPEMMLTTDSKKNRRKGLLTWDGKIGKPALSIKKPDISIHLPLWGMPSSTGVDAPAPTQSNPASLAVGPEKPTLTNVKTTKQDGQVKPEPDSSVIREGRGGPALGPAKKEEASPKEEAK